MPRSRLMDVMQSHRFWLFDAVPSATFPYLVLGAPFLGFRSITAPEVTLEVEPLKQMNSMFKRPIYGGGEVGAITLQRGVRAYDETMWDWLHRAIKGTDSTYRNLVLIDFTSIGATASLDFPIEAWESVAFLPGKAWLLWESIPTRYKAATDFDGMSGEVGIAELDIQPWAVTEITCLDPI